MPAKGTSPKVPRPMRTKQQVWHDEAMHHPKLTTTDKQTQLIDIIRSGKYLYIAMGGGIRGTKTFGFLIALVLLCKMFPGSRWAIVRKDLATLRRNTLPSFNKIKDLSGGFVGDMNQSDWIARCRNGSQILFFAESFNIDPDQERWKGLEVNGFLLEEASELNVASKDKAIERAGSWIIPNVEKEKQPPPFVFFSFNPCANWPRAIFYEPHKLGSLQAPYYYLPATAADNPFIPDAVRESWKNLPPNLYARFVLGEWNFTEDPDQLIKYEWIEAAFNRDPQIGLIRNRAGADVARYGNDKSVFAGVEGTCLKYLAEYEDLPVDKVAENFIMFCNRREFYVDGERAKVDGVGVGAGVVDLCRKNKFPVVDLIAGAKPVERKQTPMGKPQSIVKFRNIRSQMWWEFSEQLRLGKDISFSTDFTDAQRAKLVADLTAVHYSIDGDKMITIEPKEDIKARIGRSTDYGDATVQAYFDMPNNIPGATSVMPVSTPLISPYSV